MRPIYTISFLFLSMLWILGATASVEQGKRALSEGDFEAAHSHFQRVHQSTPQDASVLILLGRAAIGLRDLDAAAEHFEQAIHIAPDHADAHYWYGEVNGRLTANASMFKAGGYAKKSRGGFERALELDPQHIQAHRGMIEYYGNAPRIYGGSMDAAIEMAERLMTIDALEGRLALAEIYADENDDKRARTQLTSLTKDHPSDPRAFLRLGFIEQGDGNFGQARDLFAHAAGIKPATEQGLEAQRGALYQVGRTSVISKQHIPEGIAAFKEYLALPITVGLPQKEWAHYRLGMLYELDDQSGLANQQFELARQTDDGDLKRRLSSK